MLLPSPTGRQAKAVTMESRKEPDYTLLRAGKRGQFRGAKLSRPPLQGRDGRTAATSELSEREAGDNN